MLILLVIAIFVAGIYYITYRTSNISDGTPYDEECKKLSFVYQEENTSFLPIDSEEKAELVFNKVSDKLFLSNKNYKISKDNIDFYYASSSSAGIYFLIYSNGTVYKKLKCFT